MQRIWSTDLPEHAGEVVVVQGWFHHLRRLSRVSFLILRDGRGLIQVVVEDPVIVDRLASLERESVLRVLGHTVAEPQAPGGVEVREPSIEVLCEALATPPVVMSGPHLKASLPTLLDHAPVTLRHPSLRETFAVSAAVTRGFRTALDERGYVEIHTPKLVGAKKDHGRRPFAAIRSGRRGASH